MSIKIEGGDGTTENVIKAGTSNELLYNDKEVLLKENFDLDLDLISLLPDLTKAQEFKLEQNFIDGEFIKNLSFTVPKDGWIVKVYFESYFSNYIKIDGIGDIGMTPNQRYIDIFYENQSSQSSITIENLNCPYPVKKGQVISTSTNNTGPDFSAIVTFAPCKGL